MNVYGLIWLITICVVHRILRPTESHDLRVINESGCTWNLLPSQFQIHCTHVCIHVRLQKLYTYKVYILHTCGEERRQRESDREVGWIGSCSSHCLLGR